MNNEQDAQEKPPEMSIDDINILYLILLNEKVTARLINGIKLKFTTWEYF